MEDKRRLLLPYIKTNSTSQYSNNKLYFDLNTRSENGLESTKHKKVFINKKVLEFGNKPKKIPELMNNEILKMNINLKNKKNNSHREVSFKINSPLNISKLIEDTKKSEAKYEGYANLFKLRREDEKQKYKYKSVDFVNENIIFNDLYEKNKQSLDNNYSHLIHGSHFTPKINHKIESYTTSKRNSYAKINNFNSRSQNELIFNSHNLNDIASESNNIIKIKGPNFEKQLEREITKTKKSKFNHLYEPNIVLIEHNLNKKLLSNCNIF
jgi:hypothetical protein